MAESLPGRAEVEQREVDLSHAARTLLYFAVLIALGALIGWTFDIVPLRQIVAGRVPMSRQTSITLLIVAVSAALQMKRPSRLGVVLAVIVVVHGGVTLLDYAVNGALAKAVFGRPPMNTSTEQTGRMAVQTAASVVALGISLLAWHRPFRGAAHVHELSALAVAFLSYVSTVGHLFGARSLWVIGSTHMAPNVAITLLALSTSFVLSPPHGVIMAELVHAKEGGYVARRLLPLALVVPVVLGWLRLFGEAGGYFASPDGTTLLVVTNTLLFAMVTWWVARIANHVATERARAESELRENQIEREVRARFVRSLAHDLRTPLAAIRAGTERLSRTATPENARVAEVVIRGANRLDLMMKDLLDVERARSGERLSVHRERGDASAVVEEVVRSLAIVHGDRIDTEIDHPIEGAWDRNALERILENLIGNAFKYGAEKGRVRVTAHNAGEHVELAVNNQGNPLRPSEIPKLLEPFARGSETRGRAGWGIGLSLVRGFCDALGGELKIESNEAEGTTFRILLPRAA